MLSNLSTMKVVAKYLKNRTQLLTRLTQQLFRSQHEPIQFPPRLCPFLQLFEFLLGLCSTFGRLSKPSDNLAAVPAKTQFEVCSGRSDFGRYESLP